jgi:5-formyltetrahydrofolate cyclo-ligase
MPHKDTPNEKHRLRAKMRELSRLHPGGDAEPHRQLLRSFPEWQQATTVLLYAPLTGEIDLMPLIDESGTHRYLFPRIEGDHLALYRYDRGSRWVIGPFELKEPDPATWERIEPESVDLALIPGLAFDPMGGRLGRGKGYYDRLLNHPNFRGIKIGVCWPWQRVDTIPRELHDALMDRVLAGEESRNI